MDVDSKQKYQAEQQTPKKKSPRRPRSLDELFFLLRSESLCVKQKSSIKVAVGGSPDEFSAAVSPRCSQTHSQLHRTVGALQTGTSFNEAPVPQRLRPNNTFLK